MIDQAPRSSGRSAKITAPVLVLAALGALLAGTAAYLSWRIDADALSAVAAGSGATAILLATALYLSQSEQSQTAITALQNIEAQVDSIVDSAMDALITVNEDQRIVLFNTAAEKIFGHPRNAVLGQPLDMLMPAQARDAHQAHVRRFGKTGVTSRRMGDQTILVGLRAGGEEFPLEASISQHDESGRKFFTVILRDVSERVRAERALRRSHDELRDLAAASISVREEEKIRIARELHDELGQALTALKMDVNWLKERLPAGPGPVAAKLEAMQSMLDTTVKATRRISSDLRPLMLDDLGLIPASEWLIDNFMQRTGIHCEFAVDPPDLELQGPHATAIFRILQESLTNVARHAHASSVNVTLDSAGDEVTLRVRDDGCGFNMNEPRKTSSCGLVGLRERAYLLDGSITVDSAPGKGTVIEVSIPLRKTESAA